VHRLDSPTSGVILASSCPEIADEIKTLFQNKEVRKTYFALVRPKGPIKEGFWKDHLKEKRENGKVRVTKGNGALAQTKVSVERKRGGLYGLALIRMEPRTGRTHQLRVQCAIRGIPIIGDKSYGDFSFNRKIARASKVDRLCLHAGEIEFELKLGQKTIHFSADSPLPRAMGKLIL
jgi:23S rRNA-/tRNA-specific pseudouridylate synthase